jgi:molybdate transport system substrate-binding protein
MRPRLLLIALVLAGLYQPGAHVAAATTNKVPNASAAQAPARVYAAASLTPALTAAAAAWQAKGHAAPILVFGGSGALAKQLDAGAPADVFAAADTVWMDYLEQRQRLLDGSRRNLLGNSLVLVAPTGHAFPVEMRKGFAIANQFSGRWCTGEPGSVPVGTYAREALQNLGWWPTLAGRLVGTEDVRSALAFVARGDCAMGIVYGTDTRSFSAIEVLGTLPAAMHTPIVYPFAAVRGATGEGLAFLDYLESAAGLTHFQQAGFSILRR